MFFFHSISLRLVRFYPNPYGLRGVRIGTHTLIRGWEWY
ncbi:hypothetical protein Zm00014a_024442 [Zea mays]|uniref:Uncharacterized protein n=1 Tax=Zea mays TaxID=4577 RepID=A0A3L6FMG9_MAIZE|nr:hypothetical protein Zm00014a_024442 [Zea mays]